MDIMKDPRKIIKCINIVENYTEKKYDKVKK